MANDDIFTVNRNFAPVEANSVEIQDGTFTVVCKTPNPIDFIKSDTAPVAGALPSVTFKDPLDSFKYVLAGAERLYARSPRGAIDIGVVTA